MYQSPNFPTRPNDQAPTLRGLLPGAALAFTALTAAVQPAAAGILLTEIHYNGPAAGTDPDEFIELVNTGSESVDLSGYRFSAGIDLLLSPGTVLGAGEVLVAARSPEDFLRIFTDYRGTLLDFGGSLSNSGETLTLEDGAGSPLWSLSYDDGSPWPGEADGAGFSLQLQTDPTDPLHPAAWLAAAPSPGTWAGLEVAPTPPRAVNAPSTLLLTFLGLCLFQVFSRALSVTRFLPFSPAIRAHLSLRPVRVRYPRLSLARESSCTSISLRDNRSSIAT